MRSCILIPEYLQETETTETVTDYVGTKKPTITISDLTKITNAQASNIINNSSVTGLSNGNYSAVYTFSDNISINSLTFKTGANGMSKLPVLSISIEAYNNGSWTTIISGSYNGDYTYNTNETLFASNSIFTNKIRLNFKGYTYSGGGLTYYASFHRFELNVDIKKVVQAGLVPQPHSVDIPKYLKKVVTEIPFVQPKLTADGTVGGNAFASFASASYTTFLPYRAFDEDSLSSYQTSTQWFLYGTSSSYSTGYIGFYNPIPLKVESLDITVGAWGSTMTISSELNNIYGSNDGVNWDLLVENFAVPSYTAQLSTYTVNVDSNTAYKYYKIENPALYRTSGYYGWYVYNIHITATEYTEILQAGTKDDYTLIIPQKHTVNVPKYLKKVVIGSPWTQPILSANGTLGGDSFAVSASKAYYPAYYAFDSKTSTNWWTSFYGPSPRGTFTIYNPVPIKISEIKSINARGSHYMNFGTGTVWASNDGTNYEQISTYTGLTLSESSSTGYVIIPVNAQNYYKYYEIRNTAMAQGTSANVLGSAEMYINATYQTTGYIAGTKDDYTLIK